MKNMRMQFIIALLIVELLLILPVSAESLNIQGKIYNPVWDGSSIIDHQEYKYSTQSDGLYKVEYDIWKFTYFGFGITGNYNSVPFTKLSTDYTWTKQLNTIPNGYNVIATTTGGEWSTKFDFTNLKTKITNTLINTYPNDITNAKFYYLLSVSVGDKVKYDGQEYTVLSNPNVHITGNLNNKIPHVTINDKVLFNFEDIMNNGFIVSDIYVVPASSLGFNSIYNVIAVGFTKGNSIIQSGQVVTIDPSLEQSGGSVTLYGNQAYDYVNLTNGAILYIAGKNATVGTGTLNLTITYDLNVDSTSSINGIGKGYSGGSGGGTGTTPTGGQGGLGTGHGTNGGNGVSGYGACGAGAGSYGTVGGNGGAGVGSGCSVGTAGSIYGTTNGTDIDMGSGAGGGGGSYSSGGATGGAGGGMLNVTANNIIISGKITMNGSAGGQGGQDASYKGGGGGGASAGGILLHSIQSTNITNAKLYSVGGAGGTSQNNGGTGGNGRVKLFYHNLTNTSTTVSSGTVYYEIVNIAPTVPSTIQNSNYHTLGITTVNWTQSTDTESDTITYDVKVYNTTTGLIIINQTGILDNYSQSFSTLNWTTYNYTVRSYDGSEYSAWSDVKTFGFTNSIPSITNITLTPINPTVIDNLTISSNETDADGDTLTKYYTWYKNSILQSAWNDLTTIIYSGNYTIGDLIYANVYVNDGYNNSSSLNSATVIIGSNNTAPSLNGITLSENTVKYGESIFINTTSNVTDLESSSIRLLTYYKNGGNNIYLNNSSWVTPPYNFSLIMVNPFNDGLNHTIYAVAEDNGNATQGEGTNLTSSEVEVMFISDNSPPYMINNSLSATSVTVGNSVIIYLNTDCTQTANHTDCNVVNATVKVSRPDATSVNWTMTHSTGTLWYKTYTATSDIGLYTIDQYWVTDEVGNVGTDTSNLTFTVLASSTSTPSGGGGGGGGSVTIESAKIDWKLSFDKIDVPIFKYGSKETLWSQTITSNIDLQSVTSGLFTTKIDDSKTNLIVSYNINDSVTGVAHEIIKIRNKNDEIKEIDVTLRIYNIGGYLSLLHIPIPIGLTGLLSWAFPIEDGEIIGVYYMTLIIIFGFFGMVMLYYYSEDRRWFYGIKNFSNKFE